MKDTTKPLPKVVLHVGRHKTGTTSIQNFLALNEDLLAAQYGVLYPSIGRHPRINHHPLFRTLVVDSQPVDEEKICAMAVEASERGCHTILLSSEMLSRPSISDGQLKSIREAFTGHELKIILYFRRQDSFLESKYSEVVKRGLLAAPKTISDIEQTSSLNYYQFAERYKSIFGKEALIIRSYDKDKDKGLIDSFLSILSIPLSDAFEEPSQALNMRDSWFYIELIRQFNRLKWGRYLVVNWCIRFVVSNLSIWFPQLINDLKPLSQKQRREILANYQPSNERLEREYLDGESLF